MHLQIHPLFSFSFSVDAAKEKRLYTLLEIMDFCRNVSLSSGLPSEYQPEQQVFPSSCSLDDLFSGHSPEGDLNLEWLSIFVEDCLSSSGNCLPPPPNLQNPKTPPKPTQTKQQIPPPLHKFPIPSKARTKRKRNPLPKSKNPFTMWSHNFNPQPQMTTPIPDPPLLQQAYWLADSELILLKNGDKDREINNEEEEEEEREKVGVGQGRRCSHCLSQKTPQWRAGPLGPKTLCNACGVRYKSGRLLPEYRPAKSPSFVSNKHSNSHKKVLEMRMSLLSSSSNS
ncbi:hypothetical protein LguiB_033634 [Lonicera macranthoides]